MAKSSEDSRQDTLLSALVIAIVLLAISQFILYRNIQSVKTMISESVMQIKEGRGVRYVPTKAMTPTVREKAQ